MILAAGMSKRKGWINTKNTYPRSCSSLGILEIVGGLYWKYYSVGPSLVFDLDGLERKILERWAAWGYGYIPSSYLW
jgi:hypothetical protein